MLVVSGVLAASTIVPAASGLGQAKAWTCQADVPGGEAACQVIMTGVGAVCKALKKPCLM